METSSTYPKSSFLRFFYTLVLVPLLLVSPGLVGEVMGQEIRASLAVSSGVEVLNPLLGPDNATVNDPTAASDHAANAASDMVSTRVLAGIYGTGDAWQQVQLPEQSEIGRASCRDRVFKAVYIWVVVVSLK